MPVEATCQVCGRKWESHGAGAYIQVSHTYWACALVQSTWMFPLELLCRPSWLFSYSPVTSAQIWGWYTDTIPLSAYSFDPQGYLSGLHLSHNCYSASQFSVLYPKYILISGSDICMYSLSIDFCECFIEVSL